MIRIVKKHENDVGYMIGCLQVVRIYSFFFFLFFKAKNNFIKEIKYVLRAFIAW